MNDFCKLVQMSLICLCQKIDKTFISKEFLGKVFQKTILYGLLINL